MAATKTKQPQDSSSTLFHESSRIGIATIKPVEKESSLMMTSEARGSQRIKSAVLPNSLSKYLPVLDSAGNFPGISREEFKAIREELDLPVSMTYDKFFNDSRYVTVALSHKPITLNKERLSDYIKYLVLYYHPWVAKDSKSIEAGQSYVIIDENKEADAYISKAEKVMQSSSLIYGMDPKERRDLLFWGYRLQKAIDSSDSVVSMELFERAKNDPEYFLEQYNKPNKELRILLATAVQFRVAEKVNNTYMFGELPLGTGEDEAAAFLAKPENQKHVISLQKEVQAARKHFVN